MCSAFSQVIHQTDLFQFTSRFFLLRLHFLPAVSCIQRAPSHISVSLLRLSASPFPSHLIAKQNLKETEKMHRSVSWNRFSDEYYSSSSPSPALSSTPGQALRLSFDGNEQPTSYPADEIVKREKARVKFAATAVHVIPLVLVLCAILLWFFSNPEIDAGMRWDPMAARIEGLNVEGEIEREFGGAQNEALPILDSTPSTLKIKRLH
ncbi:hypothetical protein SDJN02_04903, partial [Cucurbita argyrosperma subsp. argyrosperma]